VGVVLHGQPEVALFRVPGTLQNIFTRSDQLDDGQREVGKAVGVGGFALEQKIV